MLKHFLLRRVTLIAAFLTALCAFQAWGEESETVVIANTPIARIRDKGPYQTLADRAAAIDKAICEVISTQDTQHPKVSAMQSKGVWYVYSGKAKVMGVYAGDAKPNNISVRNLAIQWANNVRAQLPLATPCSKLPRSAFQPKPGQVVKPLVPRNAITITPATSVVKPAENSENLAAPAATSATPAEAQTPAAPAEAPTPAAPQAADENATPAATTPATVAQAPAAAEGQPVTDRPGAASPATTPETTPSAPAAGSSKAPRNASLLLILDSFNVVRNLSQEDYINKRDEVASNLLSNLTAFMAEAPVTSPKPVALVATQPAVAAPSATTGPSSVLIIKPRPKPVAVSVAPKAVAKLVAKPKKVTSKAPVTVANVNPAGNAAASSKVAQKNRIKSKMAQCQAPWEALRASDPATADQIGDLLKASRTAFAARNFDAAEEYVDHAMKLLGIETPGAAQ